MIDIIFHPARLLCLEETATVVLLVLVRQLQKSYYVTVVSAQAGSPVLLNAVSV